ncbi:MAG: NAD(P)H-dependent oxidoreductase [Flavobacteriaceae bacterium]|nr:NAD(P)H-dependent oxidoreductase [Flavobacteriaceae bacterium]
MNLKKVIILGSSRKNGETAKIATELVRISNWDLIDLSDYEISHFDYNHLNRNDDFLDIFQKIVTTYDVLIFATPVYWYAMSGIMKVFFDRMTDLLTIDKVTGRKLRGKYMAAISSSNGDNLNDDFWLPFKKSAAYLGMTYIGDLHTYNATNNSNRIMKFKQIIASKTKI